MTTTQNLPAGLAASAWLMECPRRLPRRRRRWRARRRHSVDLRSTPESARAHIALPARRNTCRRRCPRRRMTRLHRNIATHPAEPAWASRHCPLSSKVVEPASWLHMPSRARPSSRSLPWVRRCCPHSGIHMYPLAWDLPAASSHQRARCRSRPPRPPRIPARNSPPRRKTETKRRRRPPLRSPREDRRDRARTFPRGHTLRERWPSPWRLRAMRAARVPGSHRSVAVTACVQDTRRSVERPRGFDV